MQKQEAKEEGPQKDIPPANQQNKLGYKSNQQWGPREQNAYPSNRPNKLEHRSNQWRGHQETNRKQNIATGWEPGH